MSAYLVMKGPTWSRTSSIPMLAWNVSSVALKVKIEPSAPPPLFIFSQSLPEAGYIHYTYPRVGEIPIASWNTRRRAPWAASPHSSSNKFSTKSSTTGNKAQHAWLTAEFTPSGQRDRLVLRAEIIMSLLNCFVSTQ